MGPLIDALAPGEDPPQARLAAARAAHPALDRVLGALVGMTIQPSMLESPAPQNVVPSHATLTLACIVAPGTTLEDVEAELCAALGEREYDPEVVAPKGGSVSDADTPLRAVIEAFLAEHDDEAVLVPALGDGYSGCHVIREAHGSVTYGFIPFRHAEPMTNLETMHGLDLRVLIDDFALQTQAALSLARSIGTQT